MSVLAEQLVAVATALAASLPADDDLDGGLRAAREGARLKQLELVGALRRMADAVGARVAGDLERVSSLVDGSVAFRQGDRSLPDTVSRIAGVPYPTAQAWCTVGEAVSSRSSLLGETLPAERPRVGAALDAGALSVEAAAVIVRALTASEPYTTVEERDGAEGFLVQQAQELTLRQLGRLCVALQDRFDPDGIAPREELLRQRAGVRRVQKRDGSTDWILSTDPESDGWLKGRVRWFV